MLSFQTFTARSDRWAITGGLVVAAVFRSGGKYWLQSDGVFVSHVFTQLSIGGKRLIAATD